MRRLKGGGPHDSVHQPQARRSHARRRRDHRHARGPRRCDHDARRDRQGAARSSDGRGGGRARADRDAGPPGRGAALRARKVWSPATRAASSGWVRSTSRFMPGKSWASPAFPAMARTNSSPAPPDCARSYPGRSSSPGRRSQTHPPARFRSAGIGYLSADRAEEGLCLVASIRDNFVAGREGEPPFSRCGLLRPAAIDDRAKSAHREALCPLSALERTRRAASPAAISSASSSRANSTESRSCSSRRSRREGSTFRHRLHSSADRGVSRIAKAPCC